MQQIQMSVPSPGVMHLLGWVGQVCPKRCCPHLTNEESVAEKASASCLSQRLELNQFLNVYDPN